MVGAGDPEPEPPGPGPGPGLVGPTKGPPEEPLDDGGLFEMTEPFPYEPPRGK